MSQQVLGARYRVEETLGRGGMAEVSKGTDTVLGRPVAIKILSQQFSQDPSFVNRFRREAQAAARLNHPNLVAVYDTGSDDGTHFIVMEYVEGRTLEDFLSRGGRLMPDRAIELATAVCDALAYAHANGVVHRDIKSGNIMVTRQGEVKVADFGIARVMTSAETVEQTVSVLGTAAYLSPEQAKGEPVDARSDIYSLGVVLYEMLTGRVPFAGDSPVAVAYKHVQEIPEPPGKFSPDVTPALEAVVMRALSKNPANRYQTAREFKEDLERVRRGEVVAATPLLSDAETRFIPRASRHEHGTAVLPPAQRQALPEREGRPWWVWVLVGLLVLAALGLALFFLARALLQDEAQQVSVPSVVGLDRRQAIEVLKDAKLVVPSDEITKEFSDRPRGEVILQDPPANEFVDEGSTVSLVISKGPEEVEIPSVEDLDEEAARELLEGDPYRFEVDVREESSEDVDPGIATRTDPPGGSRLAPGSAIILFISSGPPEPQTVFVPDVVCDSLGHAQAELAQEGLEAQIADFTEFNPECPQPNMVARQEPGAGEQVQSGSTVLLIGTEPAPETSPPGD